MYNCQVIHLYTRTEFQLKEVEWEYVQYTIKFIQRDDIDAFIKGEFESLFIEAEINDTQNNCRRDLQSTKH